MKKIIYLGIIISTLNVFSQTILTKEQALQSLLENNYNVKLAKNDVRIAANNASIYNTGFLPSVSANAGGSYTNNNQETEAGDGSITTNNGLENQNYSASVGINYTLFDGFNRKYLSRQLQEQVSMSELEARAVLEQAILDVYVAYYQTAEITENVNIMREALEISKQRLQRSKYQYKFGQTNKLSILNAEVDVNNDSIAYINTKLVLDASKRNLLLLLGDTEPRDFTVETMIDFIPITDLESLLVDLPQNSSMQQIETLLEISHYNSKISKSGYLPRLGVNTSYGWSENKNPITATISETMTYGLNTGVSLSWNIFDGGATKTRVQNAQINQENQLLVKEQLEHQLRNAITNSYYEYQNKRFVLQAQEQNLLTAQTNFTRTQDQFKIGRVSSVEYRQAQLNLLNAQTTILAAKYDAKLVELQLLQLTGKLL